MLLMILVCALTQQVADGMEMGKEDSDEEKVAALSAVVAVGETVYVKVVEIKEDDGSGRCRILHLPNVALLRLMPPLPTSLLPQSTMPTPSWLPNILTLRFN